MQSSIGGIMQTIKMECNHAPSMGRIVQTEKVKCKNAP
jgi:hypothetical protein